MEDSPFAEAESHPPDSGEGEPSATPSTDAEAATPPRRRKTASRRRKTDAATEGGEAPTETDALPDIAAVAEEPAPAKRRARKRKAEAPEIEDAAATTEMPPSAAS